MLLRENNVDALYSLFDIRGDLQITPNFELLRAELPVQTLQISRFRTEVIQHADRVALFQQGSHNV